MALDKLERKLTTFLFYTSLLILLLGVVTVGLDDWRYRDLNEAPDSSRSPTVWHTGVWVGVINFVFVLVGLIAVHNNGWVLRAVFAVLLFLATLLAIVLIILAALAVKSESYNHEQFHDAFVRTHNADVASASTDAVIRTGLTFYAQSVLALYVIHSLLVVLGSAFLAAALALIGVLVSQIAAEKKRAVVAKKDADVKLQY